METKFKTKILLKDTLREVPVKGSIAINVRTFKTAVIRNAANSLKSVYNNRKVYQIIIEK